MFNKIFLFLFLISFINISYSEVGQEKSLEISLEKNAENQDRYQELVSLTAYKEAINVEFKLIPIDQSEVEKFWKKISEKNFDLKAEVLLLKPLFIKENIAVIENSDKSVSYKHRFQYELNKNLLNDFHQTILRGYDASQKTLFLLADIGISRDMSWADVGVNSPENFSGVIIDSWKKWGSGQFKNFSQIVVLPKDFSDRPLNMNPESVTLKWNSLLKKAETFQDRQSARFELIAQYVLVSSKTNQTLIGFDFPTQKKEVGITNSKSLSSTLASLIYNLLTTQGGKINSAIELNAVNSSLMVSEFKLVGKHGLYDLTLVNNFLNEKFKDIKLTSELKSYQSTGSILTIKSSLTADALILKFTGDGGNFPLNEQKILVFSPNDQTFAIIQK